jgi:hypothetical protein
MILNSNLHSRFDSLSRNNNPTLSTIYNIVMEAVPTPKGYPLIGNVLEIDPERPNQSLASLFTIHGKMPTQDASQYGFIVYN